MNTARQGRGTRPHVPVAERRRQLTDAAMEVMRRDGAWSLTTRAVANQAQVPLGAVHYAYASKAELVRSVFESDLESATALVNRAVATGGPPAQIITRAMTAYAKHLQASPRTELVLQELTLMAARDEDLAPLARESLEKYRHELAAFLRQVADTQGGTWTAPVEVLAELLLAHLVGLAQNWLGGGGDEIFHESIQHLGQMYGSMLQPDH